MNQRRGARRGLLLLVAAAFFMENLDATIVTTAAPAIARSLHVEASDVGVTITAYLVTVAAVIPASGWVTGRWGARRTFGLAVVLFTAASGACALCTTLPELTAARIVQAVGGALMVPVGRLTVFSSTDRRDLVRVVAWMTWPALVAPVVAPLIGGVLVTYLSWPWIFAVNIPLGVVALAVTGRLIPDDGRDRGRRLDVTGLVLTATALGTLVYAAEATSSPGEQWLLIGTCAAVALVLGAWVGPAPVANRSIRSSISGPCGSRRSACRTRAARCSGPPCSRCRSCSRSNSRTASTGHPCAAARSSCSSSSAT